MALTPEQLEKRKKINKKIMPFAIIAFAFLFIVIILPSKDKGDTANKMPTKRQAYIIAETFAKEHYGSADYEMINVAPLPGDYYNVIGRADIPGKRIKWFAYLHFKGGDWADNRNWDLTQFNEK